MGSLKLKAARSVFALWLIRMRVQQVRVKILRIRLHQLGAVLERQEILGVSILGLLRVVERPGEHGRVVDNQNLIVGDGVLVVDKRRDAALWRNVAALYF